MATTRWIGAASATQHVETITIAGVWATTDTVSVTCGGSTLTVTIGAAFATSDVADALSAAINAADKTTALIGDETISAGGRTLPEFFEFDATVSGSVVTVTAKIAGLPFTLSTVYVTAGSGTSTRAVFIAGTGPNFFDNAANWSGGAVPPSLATIRYDHNAVDCLYNIDYPVTSTRLYDVVVTTDYTGRIGLKHIRDATSDNKQYHEYRNPHLKLYDNIGARTFLAEEGELGGVGGFWKFDMSSYDCASVTIHDAGSIKSEPGIVILGGSAATDYIGKGWVEYDTYEGGLTAGHTFSQLDVGGRTGSTADPKVTLGTLSAFSGAITATINSGSVIAYCKWDQGATETALVILGGIVEGRNAQAHAAVTIQAGQYKFSGSGSMAGAVSVWSKGTLDLTGSGEAQSYAGGVSLHGGATLKKGGHSITPTYVGCTADDTIETA